MLAPLGRLRHRPQRRRGAPRAVDWAALARGARHHRPLHGAGAPARDRRSAAGRRARAGRAGGAPERGDHAAPARVLTTLAGAAAVGRARRAGAPTLIVIGEVVELGAILVALAADRAAPADRRAAPDDRRQPSSERGRPCPARPARPARERAVPGRAHPGAERGDGRDQRRAAPLARGLPRRLPRRDRRRPRRRRRRRRAPRSRSRSCSGPNPATPRGSRPTRRKPRPGRASPPSCVDMAETHPGRDRRGAPPAGDRQHLGRGRSAASARPSSIARCWPTTRRASRASASPCWRSAIRATSTSARSAGGSMRAWRSSAASGSRRGSTATSTTRRRRPTGPGGALDELVRIAEPEPEARESRRRRRHPRRLRSPAAAPA